MYHAPMRSRLRLTWCVLVAAGGLVSVPPCGAAQDDVAPPADSTASDASQASDSAKPRQWLMREGSLLVRARGTMERDAETGWWQFTIDDDIDDRVQQTLGLLPCTLLDEMARVEESLPGREVVFEVTGQIFVYHNRNYLLPTIAPQLIEYGPPHSAESNDPPASSGDAKVGADGAATAADDMTPTDDTSRRDTRGDSVEDIIGELESSVGTLARSPASASAAQGGSESMAHVPGSFDTLVREQTMVLSRRGQVTRNSGGAWVFVFDADAQGLADPPMILMPCLLLEHLEKRVWRSGASVPVLISGRVYVFENRNYLVPTSFQIAREQTPLSR